MPRDYEEVSNIADVLMQTTQFSGSFEAHNRNVANTSVYITPDLSGYTSMSFGTEEISRMIQISYEVAISHEREVDSLARIVGHGGTTMKNSKAFDLCKTKVKVTSVEYNGITDKEMHCFLTKSTFSWFFHIISAVRGRYIVGWADGNDYMFIFVGGVMEGRYFDHQLPFIGLRVSVNCQDLVTMIDVDFRFKVYKNLYLSLVTAAMHDGNVNSMSEHTIYAAGLKLAYKGKFGPVQANAHWNSKNMKKVGFYVGVGYDY